MIKATFDGNNLTTENNESVTDYTHLGAGLAPSNGFVLLDCQGNTAYLPAIKQEDLNRLITEVSNLIAQLKISFALPAVLGAPLDPTFSTTIVAVETALTNIQQTLK